LSGGTPKYSYRYVAILLKRSADVSLDHSLDLGLSNFTSNTNLGSSTGPNPAIEAIVVPAPFNGFPCLYVAYVPVLAAM